MKVSWTAFLTVLISLNLPLGAQTTFVLAAEDDWYPYSAKIGTTAQGFAVELISAAYQAAGAAVTYEVVPFSRAMAGVKSGIYAGCFDAGEREDLRTTYLFPKNLLALSEQVVWGRVTASPVKTYADLEGKVVGIVNAYTYSPLLTENPNIKKDVATAEAANLKKVAVGRNDATVVDWWVAQYLMSKNKADLQGKLKSLGVLQTDRIYPVFSKAHPDGAKALELYDRGMDLIRKNGTYDKIMKAWADKFRG